MTGSRRRLESNRAGANRVAKNNGFTLVEVLIVVVIMAVLAATVIPQFSASADDARESALAHNLHTMRAQIELYKVQHDGVAPTIANDADGVPSLPQLYSRTNAAGAIGVAPATYPFGPYVLNRLPPNPLNGNKYIIVDATASWPPSAQTAAGGWFYNEDTGEIKPNATDHLED